MDGSALGFIDGASLGLLGFEDGASLGTLLGIMDG